MEQRRYLTDEEAQYLRDLIPGRAEKDVLRLFAERFEPITDSQLANFKVRFRLHSGVNSGRFQKGMIPANKGKRVSQDTYEKIKRSDTWFEKGHVSANTKQEWTAREIIDDYVQIKTDKGQGRHKWKLLHVLLWQAYHGRKVPDNCCVIFLNGDHHDFRKENLELVTRNELARMNQRGLRFTDAESTKAGLNVVRLNTKILEIERNKNV